MIISGENQILGRLASYAAKQLLLGEEVVIVNCEKVMISGKKKDIIRGYKERLQKGSVRKGPFFPRKPEMIVRRVIRGMLPYKQEKGVKAFSRLRCHRVMPEDIKGAITVDFNVSKLPTTDFVSVGEVSRELRGLK